VRLVPPSAEDAEIFLSRRCEKLRETDDWKPALGKIVEAATHYGSYAFLRRLANRLNQTRDVSPGSLLQQVDAITVNLRTRKPKAA